MQTKIETNKIACRNAIFQVFAGYLWRMNTLYRTSNAATAVFVHSQVYNYITFEFEIKHCTLICVQIILKLHNCPDVWYHCNIKSIKRLNCKNTETRIISRIMFCESRQHWKCMRYRKCVVTKEGLAANQHIWLDLLNSLKHFKIASV